MKRLLFVLVLMCFALFNSIFAEETKEASPEFGVKKFEAVNIVGEPLVNATLYAGTDTMFDVSITVTVSDTTDSTHVDLAVLLKRGARTITRESLSGVSTDSVLWLPIATWEAGIPDSLFSAVLTNTRPLIPGEEFKLEVKDWPASPVFLDPPLSRLTVIPAWTDTLADATDTTYSPIAAWGGYRWMTLGFKGVTSSMGDDGNNWIGFGQQRKIDDEWYEMEAISDSFRIPLTIARDTTFAHPVADSIRFFIWGNGSTTNFYLEFLKWIGRN